ncbi:MAG: hypothetical protein AB7O04_03785 [Hyphomonadaceae bacterium]
MKAFKAVWIALGVAFAPTIAFAQTQTTQAADNPVLTHYRAYQAALTRRDYVAAESEASAALAASEARSGDGGATVVLALNLAQIRLDLDRRADARAPAQRAQALAQAQGAASRVDPALAQLVLARAELSNNDRTLTRLRDALSQVSVSDATRAALYAGAADLARGANAERRHAMAADAWALAAAHADGAPILPAIARTQALTNEGLSLALDNSRRGRTTTGTYLPPDDSAAFDRLRQAVEVIGPLVVSSRDPEGRMTIAEVTAAYTLAVWNALRSLGESFGPDSAEPNLALDRGPANATPCRGELILDRRPYYPGGGEDLNIGAVVVRFQLDADGRIIDRRVAAAVPQTGGFVEAVESVYDTWRVVRGEGDPPGCSLEGVKFAPITFVLS